MLDLQPSSSHLSLKRKTTSSKGRFGLQLSFQGLVFSPQYVRHEQDEACRQTGDDKLVDREDVLQRVDPLLHGAGVEVVVDAGCDAPQRPHGVHHQRHGGADSAVLQVRDRLCQRLEHKTYGDVNQALSIDGQR